MLKAFRNLISTRRERDAGQGPGLAPRFPPLLLVARENEDLTVAEIDSVFSGKLLGAHSATDGALNQFEQQVIRELDRLVASGVGGSELVPRLPAVLPQMMRTLRDEEADSAALAKIIAQDVALVGDVIRLVNSPYYRTREQVRSLQQATVVLGRNGLRQLVSNALLKPLLNIDGGHFVRLSSALLWEHAEKSAVACDYMARRTGVDRFHAYLAGILQNIGFTVSMQLLDRLFDGTEAPNSARFRQQLTVRSRLLSMQIVRQWEMPEGLVEALAAQARPPRSPNVPPLASLLYAAEKLAKLQLLVQSGDLRLAEGEIQCNLSPFPADLGARCFRALQADR